MVATGSAALKIGDHFADRGFLVEAWDQHRDRWRAAAYITARTIPLLFRTGGPWFGASRSIVSNMTFSAFNIRYSCTIPNGRCAR